jgi:hypothetical protein
LVFYHFDVVGLIEEFIRENGKMENKMAKLSFLILLIVVGKKGCGKMEKNFNG